MEEELKRIHSLNELFMETRLEHKPNDFRRAESVLSQLLSEMGFEHAERGVRKSKVNGVIIQCTSMRSMDKGSRMDSYDVNIFWGMGEIEELLVIPFDLPVYQIIELLEEGMKTFIQKLFDNNKINYEIQNTE